jgi:hypothetical protein
VVKSIRQSISELAQLMIFNHGCESCKRRWLGCRLELLGAVVILAAGVFVVLGRGMLSGGIVGLSISYALQVFINVFQ